jgi:hypothetical protein
MSDESNIINEGDGNNKAINIAQNNKTASIFDDDIAKNIPSHNLAFLGYQDIEVLYVLYHFSTLRFKIYSNSRDYSELE